MVITWDGAHVLLLDGGHLVCRPLVISDWQGPPRARLQEPTHVVLRGTLHGHHVSAAWEDARVLGEAQDHQITPRPVAAAAVRREPHRERGAQGDTIGSPGALRPRARKCGRGGPCRWR